MPLNSMLKGPLHYGGECRGLKLGELFNQT